MCADDPEAAAGDAMAACVHQMSDGFVASLEKKLAEQGDGAALALAFASKRPTVLLIGDDYEQSFGPAAFHRKSARRFLARVASAVVVAGAPEVTAYAAAVAGAVLTGQDALIVETTERWEADWLRLIQAARPGLPTLISTPGRQGRGLH